MTRADNILPKSFPLLCLCQVTSWHCHSIIMSVYVTVPAGKVTQLGHNSTIRTRTRCDHVTVNFFATETKLSGLSQETFVFLK